MIIITIKELFMICLKNPKKLWLLKDKPLRSTKSLIMILTLILMLPGAFTVQETISKMVTDMSGLAEAMPEFSIKNNQLDSPSKGLLYKADSFTFTFDPTGDKTPEDISLDAKMAVPAVAFLKDGIFVDFSINQTEVPYDKVPDLNTQTFKETIAQVKQQAVPFTIFLIVCFYIGNLLLFLVILLLLKLMIKLLIMILFKQNSPYKGRSIWQVTVASSIFPVIVYSLFGLFQINYFSPVELIVFIGGIQFLIGNTELAQKMKK